MGGKTAILIGATGLVGKQVLEKLLALPVYEKVIAVSRKPVAPHPKLQNLIVDFDKLADSLVNLHADEAFCCLGTTLKQAGLTVLGEPLLASYSAFRSGHALNNLLLRRLLAEPAAWEVVAFDDERLAPAGFAQLSRAW